MREEHSFWRGRHILLTGHTGFKGAWLTLWLEHLGAKITGIALPPKTKPSLYEILSPWTGISSHFCDIREADRLHDLVTGIAPDIVIHMAAQPLVRQSYADPLETIDTNVRGTANLLQALRAVPNLAAILVITSDKVYENRSTSHAFLEQDKLGGDDPYSASKAATEIIVHSFATSFFEPQGIPVCTARAGNVVGGGDWGADRLIPDLWRAWSGGTSVDIRYPQAVRPWQHVLDPLSGYLRYAQAMIERGSKEMIFPRTLNFGPETSAGITVQDIAERVATSFAAPGCWQIREEAQKYPEKTALSLDSSLSQTTLGWTAKLDIEKTLKWTTDWYHALQKGEDMRDVSLKQISDYPSTG